MSKNETGKEIYELKKKLEELLGGRVIIKNLGLGLLDITIKNDDIRVACFTLPVEYIDSKTTSTLCYIICKEYLQEMYWQQYKLSELTEKEIT